MVNVVDLDKIIDIYKNSDDICIFVNSEVCDTENTLIWTKNNELHFEFMDDDIRDFKVTTDEIKKVTYKNFSNMIIVTIKLNNGDTVMIHNM